MDGVNNFIGHQNKKACIMIQAFLLIFKTFSVGDQTFKVSQFN
jgi:hypothetical protein